MCGRCVVRWTAPEDSESESEVLDLRRAGHIFDDVSAQLVATRDRAAELARQRAVQRASTDRRRSRSKAAGRGSTRSTATRSSPDRPRGDLSGPRRTRPRGAGPPDGLAGAAVLAAGRFRRGRRVVRVLRHARDRRGDRADRPRRQLPWQPAVAVSAVADGGLPRHRRSRPGVRLPRRRDRRGGVVHPRRGPRSAGPRGLE